MPEGFNQQLGTNVRYGVDWLAEGWLAEGVTITDSDWSVSPDTGWVISDQEDSPVGAVTRSSVMFEPTEPGYYRLTNSVTASDTSRGKYEFLIAAESATLESSYLTPSDAETRLWGRYGIEAEVTEGDLIAASSSFDAFGPWISYKKDSEQTLAFPRSINPDGTENTSDTAPADILDAVSLLAYEMSREDTPPVKSRGLIGASITYERAAIPRTTRLYRTLIAPYLLKSGERL